MEQLHAVVTGASSGIGYETVRSLTRDHGMRVTAVARRRDRLDELAAQTGCAVVQADITSQEDVDRLARELDEPVHVLVNNAGGAIGWDTVAESSLQAWSDQYELNVVGTVRVTQALLPALTASGRGDVVVVTSTAGHEPYENGAGYVAAKHAAVAMTRTLRLELTGTGVRVIEIAPGMVRTEEFSLNRFGGDDRAADAVYEGIEPLTAHDIAEAITWAVTRPHHVNIDQLVIRPREQAGAAKTVRRPSNTP
ncbi:SDR family oxidoreductase [Demequina muriae]|uniref:SDR family NAD(P)-dependent oxidoreductase n=1 Tax=Demequina muriae TaxID=3051664 RepID=A0ABT8GE07_9MICO|nr:SDR family NAD(P)-dependent oxidoreductase [Demequina sp. EGI L300058]MDN4479657.1 SDR family NAD(P)-dependent oxidoreductase [Demequina sp. EGI L300058]